MYPKDIANVRGIKRMSVSTLEFRNIIPEMREEAAPSITARAADSIPGTLIYF